MHLMQKKNTHKNPNFCLSNRIEKKNKIKRKTFIFLSFLDFKVQFEEYLQTLAEDQRERKPLNVLDRCFFL